MAATNLVLALLSPNRHRTPKPWISCISTPANTRANPPQWVTSSPTTGRGSRRGELVETETGKGRESETWTDRAPHRPSASCPLTTTWDTPCCQANMTCPMPQVSPLLSPPPTSAALIHYTKMLYWSYMLNHVLTMPSRSLPVT